MLLSEIVDGYIDNPPAGFMLDREFVVRCLKNAVRYYCGYAKITSAPFSADEIHDVIDASNSIDGDQDFDLNPSEYAVIKRLFELYVERENAMHIEASRGLGVDVFGRTVSEIEQEIIQAEQDLPKRAFMEPAWCL